MYPKKLRLMIEDDFYIAMPKHGMLPRSIYTEFKTFHSCDSVSLDSIIVI